MLGGCSVMSSISAAKFLADSQAIALRQVLQRL
jgi:hypothetical protein